MYKIFNIYFSSSLLLRIMIGLALGTLAGMFLSEEALSWIYPIGDMFLNALKMIIVPVVLSSIIVGTASMEASSLGRIGGKLLLIYAFYSILAITIGIVIAQIFHPGKGINLAVEAAASGQMKDVVVPTLSSIIVGIIPSNVVVAMSTGNMLQIIFFAMLFGVGTAILLASNDERKIKVGKAFLGFFEGLSEVVFLIIKWIMQLAPFGVLALIAKVVASQGAESLRHLGYLVLIIYTGYIFYMLLVYTVTLRIFGIDVRKFFMISREAILAAFVTRSSSGVLPISMKNADELGINKSIYSFSLPLGATINMNGTALYLGSCVVFIAYAVGQELTLMQNLTVIATATLAAIGTAGVPGAGVLMLYIALESVGLKIESGTAVALAYAMVLSMDAVLDMGRTALNVAGDLVGTAILAKSENKLDMEKIGVEVKNPG